MHDIGAYPFAHCLHNQKETDSTLTVTTPAVTTTTAAMAEPAQSTAGGDGFMELPPNTAVVLHATPAEK